MHVQQYECNLHKMQVIPSTISITPCLTVEVNKINGTISFGCNNDEPKVAFSGKYFTRRRSLML